MFEIRECFASSRRYSFLSSTGILLRQSMIDREWYEFELIFPYYE